TLYDKLNFVFLRDVAPIACIIRTPLIMEAHPSVPAKTVPEFIAYAKANPGKINMASAGTGTPSHLAGELWAISYLAMRRVHGMELARLGAHPPEIVEKLNRQINAAVADPIIKARLVEQGGTVFSGPPTDFEKLIADDTAKWAKVIREANIKPEQRHGQILRNSR